MSMQSAFFFFLANKLPPPKKSSSFMYSYVSATPVENNKLAPTVNWWFQGSPIAYSLLTRCHLYKVSGSYAGDSLATPHNVDLSSDELPLENHFENILISHPCLHASLLPPPAIHPHGKHTFPLQMEGFSSWHTVSMNIFSILLKF